MTARLQPLSRGLLLGAGTGESIVRATLRALVQPRRLLPVMLTCAALNWGQWRYSLDARAVPLGILLCLAFVVVAPVSWRILFDEPVPPAQGLVRLGLYGFIGLGTTLTLGLAVPRLLHIPPTFLTMRGSLMICSVLFLVGGWGLGRDIEMEQHLVKERARTARHAHEAELARVLAVRSHLDPHFLFNTLNAIAEWCRQDGEVAEHAVLQLSSILRAVLAGVREASWPLSQELELVRTLFALHLLRDPGLFTLRFEVEPAAAALPVAPMILLPLAENAVKHGPAAGHRGEIVLRAAMEGDRLRVSVSNPGAYAGPRAGSDGLPLLERRLALAYGRKARFHIGPQPAPAAVASRAAPAPQDVPAPRTAVELILPASGPVALA